MGGHVRASRGSRVLPIDGTVALFALVALLLAVPAFAQEPPDSAPRPAPSGQPPAPTPDDQSTPVPPDQPPTDAVKPTRTDEGRGRAEGGSAGRYDTGWEPPGSTTPPPEPKKPEKARPYLVTLRASAGLGGGSYSEGGRASLAGEFWFANLFGVGAFLATSGQPFGSTRETLNSAGATAAIRTASSGPYALFTAGVGHGWGQTTTPPDCNPLNGLYGPPSSCPPPQTANISTLLFDLSGAWLFHVGPLETGFGLHLDVATQTDVMVTGDFNLGFAL
jgi:hypothetical protein